MQVILHRINTKELLLQVPENFGVEVDIRSQGKNLVLHHDPFKGGELFEEWLKLFNHRTLILNVKEEGLENLTLDLMKKYQIKDFFFLDQSFPFLRKTAILGENRCAVRLSEYENIETVLSLSGMVKWVWIDCFTHFPINKAQTEKLIDAGFKLCFVSPELQGRLEHSHVTKFRNELEILDIKGDAVCTKYANLWG